MLQFDVCCKAIDQNFDCGCDRCAILRLDSLTAVLWLYIEFEFPAVLLVCGPRVGGLGCLLEERGEGGTFSRDFGAKGLHIFC